MSEEFPHPKHENGSILRASSREIRRTMDLPAPPSAVWEVWTTPAGVSKFFAPSSRIDLAIGGAYEMIFMEEAPLGTRGSEGCTILSFSPGRMLSFTWNAPPHFPMVRGCHTWVVLLMDPLPGGGTQLTLTHTGWGEGSEWDKAFAYFERAWSLVLARLRHSFEKGPIDWENPFVPEELKGEAR